MDYLPAVFQLAQAFDKPIDLFLPSPVKKLAEFLKAANSIQLQLQWFHPNRLAPIISSFVKPDPVVVVMILSCLQRHGCNASRSRSGHRFAGSSRLPLAQP